MIFTSRLIGKGSSTSAIILVYLAMCLLAPWFHWHPETDHANTSGDRYHSHTLPFASPSSESGNDGHQQPAPDHFSADGQLLDEMQAPVETHSGNIASLGKLALKINFFGLFSAVISPPTFVVKTTIKFLPVQSPQDYFVLTATGPSPPLA